MAQIKNDELTITRNRKDKNYSDKPDQREVKFKSVADDGISFEVIIKGPSEIIDQRFVGFPLDKDVKVSMKLSTSQQTLANSLNASALVDTESEEEQKETDLESMSEDVAALEAN